MSAAALSNAAVPDGLDEMERSVLVHNVQKEDDVADARLEFDSDFSMDDEEEEQQLGAVVESEGGTNWAPLLTQHRPKNNTGGKGVLEDYKEATRITKRQNETRRLQELEAMKRAGGASASTPSLSLTSQLLHQQQANHPDEDDEDEEFIRTFRAQRLDQFSAVSALPQHGKVKAVGNFEFVDIVDTCDPRTHVVLHLYEDYLSACTRMNAILSILAERYPHVLFLKLLATEADQTLSHKSLPAFLVYKGGKRCGDAAVNAVKTELHNDLFTAEDVEWLLASKYAVPFPGVDVSEEEKKRRAAEGNKKM
jgi:hypothetical protein